MKKNIALLIISSLLSLLLLEAALRYFGIYKSYNERSGKGGYISFFLPGSANPAPFRNINFTQSEFTTHWQANNEGLKDKPLSISKMGKRVLIFGDSFTEGVGAPNDSAYPRLFEQMVNRELDSSIQVINCGQSGADLFTEYKLFTERMLKYQPDIVLLTFNTTDFDEYAVRGGFERFVDSNKLSCRKPPWFEKLYAKSYLVRTVVHKVFRYDYSFLNPKEQEENIRMANKMMKAAIDSFAGVCNAREIKLGIIFHPRSFEITDPKKYIVHELISYCAEQKIPYTDAFLFFKQNNVTAANINSFYWKEDGHLKAEGYSLLAKCAFNFFRDSLRANKQEPLPALEAQQ